MRRSEFDGAGKVFRFTLAQYLKAKSTIITMLLMVMAVICSVFIAGFSMKGDGSAPSISTVAIINRTGYAISAADVAACDPSLTGLAETAPERADATLTIELQEGGYAISAQGDADDSELAQLESAALAAFELERAGISAYTGQAMALDDYINGAQEEEDGFAASFTVSYVYSILVLVLVMFSSSYIIRSVLEEKASRLVEMLMVSVKPLALILGKILASMCLVLIQLALMALGGVVAAKLAARFAGAELTQMVLATGALSVLAELDVVSAVAAVVSILLGFLTFSLIGGLSASCCDSMEDMNSATTATVFTALGGYLVAIVASAFDGAAATVFSLIPFVSVFVAPVKYLEGSISIAALIAAWALQAAVIALLALLCRKVYAALIMHTGSRVKLRAMLRMAGIGGGK